KFNNQKVFIDYAHHPTEIKSFIGTFNSEFKENQIIFQPHTYSRTKTFFKDFVSVLSSIDNLIIYKEYSAREKLVVGATAKDLYFEIKKINPNVEYCESLKSVLKSIKPTCVLAFVGAGNINLVAQNIVKIST
ncbi:MAG: UDP-N-acetylmuramate--L-alanine ligase, partial [Clostridia bacterium]|nr:UDP-N-acetylmuramate--L-alanine ligase [Clostridia bacterium]